MYRYEIAIGYRYDNGMRYATPCLYATRFIDADTVADARMKAIERIYKQNNYNCSHVKVMSVSLCDVTT